MAITIESEPAVLTTASNPCNFEFSSTNTGQDAFSFVVELTVNGTVHSYHQVFVESGTVGKFNASEILRSIVFSDLVTDGTIQTPYVNAVASYSIRVREKYGDPPVEVGSWYSSNTVRAFNGSLRLVDWLTFDYADYDVASGNSKLMLTGFPRTEQHFCSLTESNFLSILVSNNLQTNIYVYLYDVTGTLIASDNMASTSTAYLIVGDVSPQTIINNMTITSGDFSTCYYYEVQFRNISTGFQTERFRTYIDTECSMYDSKRLHWLNKFGVWDSYSFNKYSEEKTQLKANQYSSERGVWSGTNTFDYNRENGERKTYSKSATDILTLNSDWVKEDKHNWLVRSLYESPKVYLEISQGVFELVNPLITSYTMKQRVRYGLLQEVVNLERTYSYVSQLS